MVPHLARMAHLDRGIGKGQENRTRGNIFGLFFDGLEPLPPPWFALHIVPRPAHIQWRRCIHRCKRAIIVIMQSHASMKKTKRSPNQCCAISSDTEIGYWTHKPKSTEGMEPVLGLLFWPLTVQQNWLDLSILPKMRYSDRYDT